jgi:cellulose biosynthesis protein BcsQ
MWRPTRSPTRRSHCATSASTCWSSTARRGFTGILEQAIATADLVLVPTGPSELDLAAVASAAAMAERAGVPFRFVLNRALSRSRLAGQADAALQERGNLLCPPVHQRVAVAAAMTDGRTALETEPDGAAAYELAALWSAVRRVLDVKSGRYRVRPFPARRFA